MDDPDLATLTNSELLMRSQVALFELDRRLADPAVQDRPSQTAASWVQVAAGAMAHARGLLRVVERPEPTLPEPQPDGFVPTPAPGVVGEVGR